MSKKDEDYYLQHPKKQKFYCFIAKMMTNLCVGDQRLWGFETPNKAVLFHTFLITFWTPPITLSQFVYAYNHWSTMTLPTLNCILCIIPIAVLDMIYIISAKTKTYRNLLGEFMDKIHLYNYKNEVNKNIDIDKTILKLEKHSRTTTWFLSSLMLINWGTWVIAPLFMNSANMELVRNKTMELQTVVHVVVPFDYRYDIQNWIIVHAFNTYISCLASFIQASGNILNYIFIFNLIGHLQILKEEIKSFVHVVEPGKDKENLTKIIKHHAFIIKIFKDVQMSFGLNVTSNYCHNLFVDSLILYNIMLGEKQTKPMYTLMMLTFMGGLVTMSLVLEEIKKQSDNLSDKVYFMPWEKMTIADQKTFLLLLMRVQPPMEFISAGGLRAGLKPTISIIKSALSYYVMLKTTMEYKANSI